MKKRFWTIAIALLLSGVILGGCGDDSDSDDKSSRKSRRESQTEDYDSDDSSSRRSDSESRTEDYDSDDRYSDSSDTGDSKSDYLNDLNIILDIGTTMQNVTGEPSDVLNEVEQLADRMDVRTAEGKVIKGDIQQMADILHDIIKYQDDPDMTGDLYDDLMRTIENLEDNVDSFIDAAERSGIDEDDFMALEAYDDLEDIYDDSYDYDDDYYDDDYRSSGSYDSYDDPDDRDNFYGSDSSDREDYLEDARAIAMLASDMQNISDDPEEAVYDLNNIVSNFSARTPEGQIIERDVKKMIDILNDMLDNQDDPDLLMELLDELSDISDDVMDDFEDFGEAAERAGVSESDLEGILY